MKEEYKIIAIKRADKKVFTVGDKFTYPNKGYDIVNGKRSTAKMRICGFEKHDKGYYVLFMPTYGNGRKEKENPWRACDLNSAILIK